ncbi:MAG: magnesium transporter CorA family protein [Candidatus Hydrogenedentota bacterium]
MMRVFACAGEGRTRVLDDFESITAAHAAEGTRLWVDVLNPSPAELAQLTELFGLPAETMDDCVTGEHRPRIEEFEDHVFLLAYGVFGAEETDTLAPRTLGIFCYDSLLITIHREPQRTINRLFVRCEQNGEQILGRGADVVLYDILDGMMDNYLLAVETFEDRLEALEDHALTTADTKAFLGELQDLRSDIVRMRRLAASHREMITPLARGHHAFIDDAIEDRLEHVLDHLTQALELLDGLRELLYGVRDMFHSRLADRMNEIMKVLTIFASLLLPLTVITGMYGMNVPLWPDPNSPFAFWGIVGTMGVVILGLLAYFRFQKWL